MANHLQHETSPYLKQHAQNPVEWYAWCPAALERARRENRPIFLSIGYSACHWCHVMEHESFEDPTIAAMMNAYFVNIKVDREERPDLDQIYMTAVQMISGRGGWPMSVFLTPELEPFFGGTYWPPTSRHGLPGFTQVIEAVHDAWQNRQALAREQGEALAARIAAHNLHEGPTEGLTADPLWRAGHALRRSFDSLYGGFGNSPKFPHATDLQLLLRLADRSGDASWREMVEVTLDRMAAGGIYDQLGGGFARYSVDERWLVPHFEKMLYDNGLLTTTYLEAYQVTGRATYAQIARETLDYVLRDMTHPDGPFYSAEDADSEGEEGRFYLWDRDEVREVLEPMLGPEATSRFCEAYDVSRVGNFEHRNILNLPQSLAELARRRDWPLEELTEQLTRARQLLLAHRNHRVRPGLDDKILASWNGWMIEAMARGGMVLAEPKYRQAAERAAGFLRTHLQREGRLLHTWHSGQAKLDAYLDDYASLTQAAITLYETTFSDTWLDWAMELADQMRDRFRDPQGGAWFYTAHDHERLIARTKDLVDSSMPSGNGLAATALLRLAQLTGRNDLREAAAEILTGATPVWHDYPTAAGQLLLALDLYLGPATEIVLIGGATTTSEEFAEARQVIGATFLPRAVCAGQSVTHAQESQDPSRKSLAEPLLANRVDHHGPLTCYVCQGQTCETPHEGLAAIRERFSRPASLNAF